MNLKNFLLLAFIVLMIGWKSCYHPIFPSQANGYLYSFSLDDSIEHSKVPDPCDGRKYCVYVYLATWCPHCSELISQIPDIRNYWKSPDRPGLKVIVGNGNKKDIRLMARQVAPPVFTDPEDEFLEALHVRSFPSFIVVDDKQHIVASGSAGYQWASDEFNKHSTK